MIKSIYFLHNNFISDNNVTKIINVITKNPYFIWIDIALENHELTSGEMKLLYKSFQFHEMSIEDCLFPQYYPKIEEF
ncbi:MAG: hypothetical protein LBM96_04735, partial [Methanobrevibacter sp.]|nr:hypothetical protein [Candidatus Methanoflexus mossambicus]